MSLNGIKVLVVESDPASANAWSAELRSAGADVEHRDRAGRGLEALLLGAVTPHPHDLVVLGPSVAASMQDAFRHTLVGALASCRLAVLKRGQGGSASPTTTRHGATFHTSAPRAALRVAHVALGRADFTVPEAESRSSVEQARTWRVLLVEDNPVNQEVAEAALVGAGMSVHAVFDGQQALEAVDERTYDAVVMDIQMPVMDGLTATRMIRRMPEPLRSLPIVAMTANVLPSYRDDARAAGMNGFVEKPIRTDVLVEAVVRAIEGRADVVAAQSTAESPSAEVLDLEVLNNLKDTFGPALVRVQTTLARDAPRRLDRMQDAAGSNDFASLRREAHSLKSSSGTFGLMRVSHLSRDIEYACSEGRHDDALAALRALAESLHADLDTLAAQMDTSD